MKDPIETKQHAAAALLQLIDQRIRSNGVNPPFELADIAVDAIALHAHVLATSKPSHDLAIDAVDQPDG